MRFKAYVPMKSPLVLAMVSCFSTLQLHAQDSLENALNKYGFTCDVQSDGFTTSYIYRRLRRDRDEIIRVYQTTHTDGQYKAFVEFSLPQAQISFHKVEEVLSDASRMSSFTQHTIHSNCFRQMLDSNTGLNMKNYMLAVNTDEERMYFINYIRQFYEVCARSFFQQYTDLEIVDCHMSDLSDTEVTSFISGDGNMLIHRKLIIKSLANNPGALQYYEYLKKELAKRKGKSVTYANMYNMLVRIGDKLDIRQAKWQDDLTLPIPSQASDSTKSPKQSKQAKQSKSKQPESKQPESTQLESTQPKAFPESGESNTARKKDAKGSITKKAKASTASKTSKTSQTSQTSQTSTESTEASDASDATDATDAK
jgi:hypothetical protein